MIYCNAVQIHILSVEPTEVEHAHGATLHVVS